MDPLTQPPIPTYTSRERLADACIHGAGVMAGLVGALWLMVVVSAANDGRLIAATALYALGLVAMLTASAAYNLNRNPRLHERLRAFDHAVIFVMIAGTYAPLTVAALRSGDGDVVFALMWLAAGAGVVLKLAWPRRFENISIALYLTMGWVFAWLWKPLSAAMSPTGLWLIVAGAALYTAGVGFHLARKLPYHNAIWHAFVLAAAACHYAAILRYVVMPAVG